MSQLCVSKIFKSSRREFFVQSKLELRQWLVLLYWWCRQYAVTDAAQEAKVSRPTAIQTYQYFRDICS